MSKVILVLLIFFSISCSDQQFQNSGSTKSIKKDQDANQKASNSQHIENTASSNDSDNLHEDGLNNKSKTLNLNLGCIEEKSINHSGDNNINISASICPEVKQKVHVLFIIDNSGSMGKHSHNNPGNDPQVTENGIQTCGRLKGAQAVIGRFLSDQYKNISIGMSVISFASDVIESKNLLSPGQKLTKDIVSEKIFCETVIQSLAYRQPGGISPHRISSATNYQASFRRAKELLSKVEGKKEIYFITDGEPTASSTYTYDHEESAIDAANSLRSEYPDLTIKAIFLNASEPHKSINLLSKITGDQNLVLLASNPDDIARKVISFPSIKLDTNSIKATIYAPSASPYTITPSITQDTNNPEIWNYKIPSLALHSENGVETENKIEVSVQDTQGNTLKSTLKINYNP